MKGGRFKLSHPLSSLPPSYSEQKKLSLPLAVLSLPSPDFILSSSPLLHPFCFAAFSAALWPISPPYLSPPRDAQPRPQGLLPESRPGLVRHGQDLLRQDEQPLPCVLPEEASGLPGVCGRDPAGARGVPPAGARRPQVEGRGVDQGGGGWRPHILIEIASLGFPPPSLSSRFFPFSGYPIELAPHRHE